MIKLKLYNTVVLFYDYALTFSLEVDLFWTKSRLTWPSFFFLLSRYSALIIHIPIAVEFFSDGLSSEVSTSVRLPHVPT